MVDDRGRQFVSLGRHVSCHDNELANDRLQSEICHGTERMHNDSSLKHQHLDGHRRRCCRYMLNIERLAGSARGSSVAFCRARLHDPRERRRRQLSMHTMLTASPASQTASKASNVAVGKRRQDAENRRAECSQSAAGLSCGRTYLGQVWRI